MDGSTMQTFLAMCGYMACVVAIGLYFARRANQSTENYFLGGRSLGPWIAAMSAEASDMSGWLLMGLPGVAYWYGLADAAWTAIGLAVGTYINWLIVARRLRSYSVVADLSLIHILQFLVRRREIARLSDDRDADVVHLTDELLFRQRHGTAGDGLQLVERAARVAQPAAAHFGDLHAARGRDGRDLSLIHI